MQLDYLNEILAEALKSFWDERGMGIRYRTTLIGIERFKNASKNYIEENSSISLVMQNISSYLESNNIISKLTFKKRENFSDVIDIKIYGCIHIGMKKKLIRKGINEPIACPCANIVMYAIEQSTGLTAELADVKMCDNNICNLCIVIFKF